MPNLTQIYKNVVFGMMLLPTIVAAETAVPETLEMTREDWLSKIKLAVPGPICKGFMDDAAIAKRLQEHKISYQNCVDLIPPIAEKCEKKYIDEMPVKINQESAMKWGRTLGECIGIDFATNYLYTETGSQSAAEESSSTIKEPAAGEKIPATQSE